MRERVIKGVLSLFLSINMGKLIFPFHLLYSLMKGY